MKLKSLREEVWRMNRELPRQGLVTMTSGNVSGRDPVSGLVVIKPSGVPYDELTPADMVVVDMAGRVVEGKRNPSVDTISHLVVYRGREDIHGIVHTHSHYATSFALLGRPLPVYLTAHADEFGQAIPVTRFADAFPLEDVGNAILETLGDSRIPGVLLRNHGVFTFGPSATAALKAAVMIEDIAHTCHLALLLGRPRTLSPAQARKFYRRYHELYGQQAAASAEQRGTGR